MRYLINGIRTALSLRIRDVKSWLVLLMIPLLVLTVRLCLPEEEAAAPVRVGVSLPEEGAEAFWALLDERSGTVLQFLLADEEEIDRNVAAGKWDCGLIVAEDFAERLEQMDTDRMFTLRISSGSTVYPLVQETISACTARLLSAGIAQEYLQDSGIGLTEEAKTILRSRLQEPVSEADCVVVTMKTSDGAQLDPLTVAQGGVDALLRWVISAVLLVHMLLCTADLGKWFTSNGVRRMRPLRSATALLASRVSADGILAAAAGCAAMLLLGDGFAGCLAVATYVCFWASAAVLMARFPAIWSAMPILPPFAVVISLLLSSVLMDVSGMLPALGGIAGYVPSAVFLRICGGETPMALAGFAVAAGILAVSWLLDKIDP